MAKGYVPVEGGNKVLTFKEWYKLHKGEFHSFNEAAKAYTQYKVENGAVTDLILTKPSNPVGGPVPEVTQQPTPGTGATPSPVTPMPSQTTGNNDYSYTESGAPNPYDFGSMDWLKFEAQNGNEAAVDRYYNYIMSEQSANTARQWTAKREDTAYQRMVSDLKSAGVNPYFALSGGSPISSATQGVNYQGGQYTSRGSNVRTSNLQEYLNSVNAGVDIGQSVLGLISSIISAVIRGKTSSKK